MLFALPALKHGSHDVSSHVVAVFWPPASPLEPPGIPEILDGFGVRARDAENGRWACGNVDGKRVMAPKLCRVWLRPVRACWLSATRRSASGASRLWCPIKRRVTVEQFWALRTPRFRMWWWVLASNLVHAVLSRPL